MRSLIILLVFLLYCSAVWAEQQKPLRIIALAPHIVETLYEIGAGHYIIATTEHADYPAAANDIPQVGNYARLQIERIMQMSPDVIIAWQTGNPQEDLDRLEKYGLNIVYSNPTTMASVADEILKIGKSSGHSEQALTVASDYTQRLNALKAKYADAKPIRVFYEMWARPLRTVANQAILQQQLEICGVDNPFSGLNEDYPLVSFEKVLESKPQVVIQPKSNSLNNTESLDWSKWPDIPAYENGFIFQPNADKTHRMTTRMLEEVEKMCELIDSARAVYYNK